MNLVDDVARIDELRRYELFASDDADLDRLVELAARVADAPIGAVTLLDEGEQRLLARWGMPATVPYVFPLEQSICARALEQPAAVMVVDDLAADARYAGLDLVVTLDLRFYAGVSLVTPSGQTVGTLCVLDRRQRRLEPAQARELTLVRDEVVRLFEMRRELGELRRSEALRQEAVEALMTTQRDLERRIEMRTREVEEARRKIARNRQQLVDAQRVAHIGSWEWSVTDNMVSWSEELFRIYGLPIGTPLGGYEGFLSRVYPDDLELTKQTIGGVLAADVPAPFVYDHRIVRTDGSVRWLHTRGELIAADETGPKRLIGCCWDVTELRAAHEAREQTTALFATTLAVTSDALAVVDAAGTVTAYNDEAAALFGLPAARQPLPFASLVAALADGAELRARADGAGESRDAVKLRDGRALEARSRPYVVGGKPAGRVWSFRLL